MHFMKTFELQIIFDLVQLGNAFLDQWLTLSCKDCFVHHSASTQQEQIAWNILLFGLVISAD
jgi:hypothetical protein